VWQFSATSLLQVLKDLDLLKVLCAQAFNNCAITIDQASTHVPRQTLTAIMENIEHNAKLLASYVPVATETVGGRTIARNLHRFRTPCCTPTVRLNLDLALPN
jgi:hypothetical protein